MFKITAFTAIFMNCSRRLRLFFNFFQQKTIFIGVLFFLGGCLSENQNEIEIEQIPVSLSFERFDLEFYGNGPEALPALKRKYPFLFPAQFSDSVWISRQKDSLQLLLQQAVSEQFKDISPLEKEISHLFQHIQYYFPETPLPRVITLTNNVDYQLKTVYADSLLLLSLDTFLGANHPLYEGIPNYIQKELDPVYLPTQIVEKFTSSILPAPADRTFIAQMIYEGKKLFLFDLLLTHTPAHVKMAYTKEELQWVKENEQYIWQYFIERQALYKTDPDWVQRFIYPAPFSKFYLELDTESPGKVGRWIGGQIVKSYVATHPEVTWEDVLQLPEQELFTASKYKPKR